MVCKQTIAALTGWCLLTAFACKRGGGDDRDRTGDPLLAKQVLSQLSYAPNLETCPTWKPTGPNKITRPVITWPQTPPIRADRIGGPGRI
jgi:hypothetical protein